MTAALAAFLIALIAFVFCAFASALFRWHPSVTGPCTAVCAVAFIACGVWLNRAAGRGDGDDDGGQS